MRWPSPSNSSPVRRLGFFTHPDAGAALDCVLGKAGVHGVPQRGIHDRLVFAGKGLILVDGLPTVNPVLQHHVERASADRLATPAPPRSAGPAFAGDAVGFELRRQEPHRAERCIAAEDGRTVSAALSTTISF